MKTFTIGWLNKCRCGNKSHSVKTARGNESALWDDDAVKCNSCGRGGVIQVCEGQARVLWETDEEMAEGKPMSTITKEQAQSVSDLKAGYTLGHADVAILNELARIALASLEAEPVAWLLSGGGAKNNVSFDSGNAYADPLREVTPLYTAPPAPVSVPDAMEMDDDFDSAFEHGKAVGWNAYRAAMLQGADGTLTNEGTIPVTQFKPVADLYGLTSPTGCETSFTFDAVEARDFIDGGWSCQEYVELERFQEAVSGNYPMIPDGWVACSEQMPKKNDKVLIFIDFNSEYVPPSIHDAEFTGSTFRRGGATVNVFPLEDGYGVTHWQPLPAAPQQEVESQIRKGKTVAREEWELGARLTKHRFKP